MTLSPERAAIVLPRWNLAHLRAQVQRLFGEEQLQIVNRCLRTVVDRRQYCRYHFNEAGSTINSFVQGRGLVDITGAMLGAYDTEDETFSRAQFVSSAHAMSCIQHLHAIADNLVHLAYFALGHNLDPARRAASERDITWRHVKNQLEDGSIKRGLTSLIDDPGFRYIAALSNQAKHRAIVSLQYSVNYSGDPDDHGLVFSEFSHEGIHYPPTWLRPTLKNEYERQETLIFSIGPDINAQLEWRCQT